MKELSTLLDNANVLGKFTTAQKDKLISLSIKRSLNRNQPLFWQGDLWVNVLLIASGKLRSVIHAPDGRSFTVSSWEKGDEFWPHSLFDGEPMPSTLEADQESVFYQWNGESVLRILFENSEAIRALLRYQIKLIRKRRDKISDLAFQPVMGRLAKILLEQAPGSANRIKRTFTLEQIASMIASSPEVVCRSLYQLQQEGIIEVTRASITINKRIALEQLVEKEVSTY